MPNKVMIVVPFWGQERHVGVYRIDRFIRWMAEKNVKIVLVKAGGRDDETITSWGIEITVRDPLWNNRKKYRTVNAGSRSPLVDMVNRCVGLVLNFLLTPDPYILWAKRAARHRKVLKHGKGAAKVLSSSPPESAHIAAYELARNLRAELIVDMRDGWLDEPLKPLLAISRLQRMREEKLEIKVLKKAESITVTSEEWKALLNERLLFTRGKTTVLTNCYPRSKHKTLPSISASHSDGYITLLHAGRFIGSSFNRRSELLLLPLWHGLKNTGYRARIILQGRLTSQELNDIDKWRIKFSNIGSILLTRPHVDRKKLFDFIKEVDGLLLISATNGPIPSKVFEYIPQRKAVLTISPRDSAVWRLSEKIPQMTAVCKGDNHNSNVLKFLRNCQSGECPTEVPVEYTETYVSKVYYEVMSGHPSFNAARANHI